MSDCECESGTVCLADHVLPGYWLRETKSDTIQSLISFRKPQCTWFPHVDWICFASIRFAGSQSHKVGQCIRHIGTRARFGALEFLAFDVYRPSIPRIGAHKYALVFGDTIIDKRAMSRVEIPV